jgi:hypothetical protein
VFDGVKALADDSFATDFRVDNGVPVVVERAMWWPGSFATWQETHTSVGATATSPRWAIATGMVGSPLDHAETYLLVLNRSPHAGQVRVTLLFDNGKMPATRVFSLLPGSRFNVSVGDMFPGAAGRSFGATVESLGTPSLDLVVERSVYSDAGGVRWSAGANALGSPLP